MKTKKRRNIIDRVLEAIQRVSRPDSIGDGQAFYARVKSSHGCGPETQEIIRVLVNPPATKVANCPNCGRFTLELWFDQQGKHWTCSVCHWDSSVLKPADQAPSQPTPKPAG